MSVKRFNRFLTEATERKILHLAHLEDTLVDGGDYAQNFAMNLFGEFYAMLNGEEISNAVIVSTKWDGSPAIVFGPDPADGRFFVGTKSVFNKTPKMAKSHEDIHAMYPESVVPLLDIAFDELQTIHPAAVLQGDILFANLAGPERSMMGDVSFAPNTLRYTVSGGTEMGQKASQAVLGIAIHTHYTSTGSTLAEMSANPISPMMYAALRQTPRVWLVPTTFDDLYDKLDMGLRFTEEEERDFNIAMSALASMHIPEAAMDVLSTSVREWFLRFLNYTVREGLSLDSYGYFNELVLWLGHQSSKEQATRSTERGKLAVAQRFTDFFDALYEVQSALLVWFDVYIQIADLKNMIVNKLNQASQVATDVVLPDGSTELTGHEGYVVTVGTLSVKLVNRPEFSRLNFQRIRSS